MVVFFFFSSRRRHTRCLSDWSSDVCSSDLSTPCRATISGKNCLSNPEWNKSLKPYEGTGERIILFNSSMMRSIDTIFRRSRLRSEERRVGKEDTYRWAPQQEKDKRKELVMV